MAKVVVVAPVKGPEERVRIGKLIGVLRELGHEIEFWGWQRGIETSEPDPNLYVRIMHRGGGYGGKKMFLQYPIWMLRVWWACLSRRKQRPIYCLSFDTAFPAAMAGAKPMLFDDADNFSKIASWPGPLKRMIERAERFAALKARIHLMPSRSRTTYQQPNDRFLPNMPTRAALEAAQAIAHERAYQPGEKLTVLVTGRMVSDRGVKQILDAYRQTEGNVHLIVAGRTFSPEAEALANEPGVEFLGQVTNEEALALNYRADLVLTYYNPAIEINRLAEPNKWGDCIVTNTPFIVNEEVETAHEFREAGACFSVPYEDVAGLVSLLSRLAKNRAELADAKTRLAEFRAPAWDDGMKVIISEWLS